MDGASPAYAGRGEGGAAGAASYGEAAAASPAEASAAVAREDAEEAPGFTRGLQVGRLTAGVFDDALNPGALARFAERVGQAPALARIAAALAEPFTVVTVVDPEGRPIVGARVQGHPTGTDGRVVILADEMKTVRGGGALVDVEYGGERRTEIVAIGQQDALVRLAGRAQAPRALDLALVIDATGSMGDELEYLKVELRGIVGEIAAAYPNVDQRWALVVYRDKGDAYVSRTFDFVGRLGAFERDLGAQSADGGGDYPEAMDRALEDAAALSWRGDAAARVLFLVADAPPHPEAIDRTLGAVSELRGRGVAVYPVAASGVAEEAELVMRAAALTTGGQYLFLTDDSGVGASHAEPHIPCYDVESLRDSMIRMVASELGGRRVEADPARRVRQVGHAERGVCRTPTLAVPG